MRIRLFTTALVLTALGALTACGSSAPHASAGATGPTHSVSAARVLTKAQARSALLRLRDLGTNFRLDKSSGSGGNSSMGCLDRFDKLDKVSPTVHDVESDFAAKSEVALPAVFSSVSTFRNIAVATKGMVEARKILNTCTAIDVTDKDGARTRLRVRYDRKVADPRVDEQLDIEASGTIKVQGFTVPMSFDIAIMRIGNNIGMAGFVTIARDSRAEFAQVVGASLVRFIPVTQGKPPGTPAPLHFEAITPATMFQSAA